MDVIELMPLPFECDDDMSGNLSNPSTMSDYESDSLESDYTLDDEAVLNTQLEIFLA
ncbi:hypothetical protein AX17_005985, partial [Amanita inopinata Kibby_2008]